ncbi:ROK family protein [Luteolibacter yonseiensis]|uniref:fructokinase n=1 Tax=Luteolibacter yonseiensis TaxID=1144680 RepID=A0A934VBX7_9BACT|nr:ROK family protein [Luteolibacter yonseiensis]MBK1817748.1 ROK family protein [Luteolibacter yonseiensis]
MIAGIELGGTKTVVAIGTPEGKVVEEFRFPTTHPEETLAVAAEWLRARGTPGDICIAAFGPVGVVKGRENYGKILATPKAGWSDFSLTGALAEVFPEARYSIDTDVNAAALAEARIGAAAGLDDVAYITIGTGIGAGILSGGHLIHGSLHPETGHLKVPRHPEDTFKGVCPFHADCLEGLASGPAIAARWGKPADELPVGHPAWDMQAWYLAHGILSLLAIVSPEKVIVGGGVSQVAGLHEKINRLLVEIGAGYFPVLLTDGDYVVPPALGQEAGICGAFLLTGS